MKSFAHTHTFLTLATLACLAASTRGAQERRASAPYCTPPGFTELYEEEVTLPMGQFGGRPIISAEINGHGPFSFILDTGSSFSAIIDKKVVEEAGVETGEVVGIPGLKGNSAVLDSLLFEGLEMSEVHAVASDVAGIFGRTENAPHGILGIGLFADCLLTFDFPKQCFVVREGELPRPGGHVISYQAQGTVSFDVDVGGEIISMHMDTGSPGSLLLTTFYEKKVPLTGEPVNAGSIQTPMGGAKVRHATLDGIVQFAGHEFARPDLRFADLPQMTANDSGNIGMGLLRGFAITFDQKTQRLRFLKAP